MCGKDKKNYRQNNNFGIIIAIYFINAKNNMKSLCLFITLLLSCLIANAQPFETQKKEVKVVVPLEKTPQLENKSNPINLRLPQKKEDNPWMKSPEKGVNFTGKSNLVQRKVDFNPNYGVLNDHKKEDYDAPKGDQFFGDFTNNGKFVNVYCRDFAAIDGDRVSLYVNGVEEVRDIFLLDDFRGFKVELKPGFNKVEFLALNQGESGPNTAEFMVVDDNGKTIVRNRWDLATGSKAQLVIVKDQ